jgi:LDH2 family malate/lactate/ureidoglycolate dehydrogenase
MPGEIESRLEAERRKTGIPFAASDLAPLAKLASDHGVAELPQITR